MSENILISELRAKIMSDPTTKAMLTPSTRNAVFLDVDGDGKADFAFIDSKCDFTGNGDLDTFALDIGNDGEFDLYLKDSDGNNVPDRLFYVEDGKAGLGIKSGAVFHNLIEGALKAPSEAFGAAMVEFAMGQKDGEFCKAAMKAYVDSICAELTKLK